MKKNINPTFVANIIAKEKRPKERKVEQGKQAADTFKEIAI